MLDVSYDDDADNDVVDEVDCDDCDDDDNDYDND